MKPADSHPKGNNMPRKKKAENGGAVAVAESEPTSTKQAPVQRPAYIDGAPVDADGRIIKASPSKPDSQMELPAEGEHGKNWGPPYKAIYTGKDFEMGENRRFKQRVFTFREKPAEDVIAALKDAGFTYRANEKAWTIQADAASRILSDDLAQQFAGQGAGMAR
jgi:hypothetical protein